MKLSIEERKLLWNDLLAIEALRLELRQYYEYDSDELLRSKERELDESLRSRMREVLRVIVSRMPI